MKKNVLSIIGSETAEAWALRETLAMCNRKGWEKIRIYSDAKDVIDMVKKGSQKNALMMSVRNLLEQAREKNWKRDSVEGEEERRNKESRRKGKKRW